MKKIHFIDCGGNIGQSTNWVLTHFDVARVDMFEPLPFNFNVLKSTMTDKRINLHNKAVWVENGEMCFYPQDYGRRVGSSLIKGKRNTARVPIKISAIDLAEWIDQNTSCNYYNILKLDIEGAEYDVLPHLFKNNIQAKIDEWFIEFHGTKTPNYKIEVEKDFYSRQLKFKDWGFCE